MLSKYDYEKLADEISDDFIENDTSLNEGIKITAIKMELNPEQIKRLTESSNIKTYNKMFDEKEDKTFDFELADSKKVISDVYDSETEIKDMPPVEYKPDNNPKAPEHSYEVLGDDDELSLSKNTVNSEDAAGDSFEDALKIPKKDYSYGEDDAVDVENDEANDLIVPSEEQDEDDEENEDEDMKKSAALNELGDINKELDRRCSLLTDKVIDEVAKTASLFKGYDKNFKFGQFVKEAYALYGDNPCFADAINLVRDHSHIDVSVHVPKQMTKFASENAYGARPFKSLLSTVTEYTKTFRAKELLERELV